MCISEKLKNIFPIVARLRTTNGRFGGISRGTYAVPQERRNDGVDGWICLHRKICENWIWSKKPFSEGQAFVDLLLMANYKEKKFRLGDEVVKADSGTIVTSKIKLSERWGWSKTKVTSFLKALESDNMITVISDHRKTTVSIVNFKAYQDFGAEKNPLKSYSETTEIPVKDLSNATEKPLENHSKTTEEPLKDTNNKDNKDNKDNKGNKVNNPPPPQKADDGFDRFWQAYPRKASKSDAFRAWKKLKPNEELIGRILNGLEMFKKTSQWLKDNGDYIPYPATWLNNRRWEEMEEQPAQIAITSYELDPNDPYAAWRGRNG